MNTTQVWQYVTLTRRIYLIDCPGIVPTSAKSDSQTSTVLKGVVRISNLPTPSEHIPALLRRVKPVYISRTYGIPLPGSSPAASTSSNPSNAAVDENGDASKQVTRGWDAEELLEKLARMKGRLLKGGEPDREGVAKILLEDWVRGRIPFFVGPPERSEDINRKEEKERRVKDSAVKAGERTKVERAGREKEKEGGKREKRESKKEREERERREKKVPGVRQNLGSIMQKITFEAEDIKPLEVDEDVEEVEDDGSDAEGEDGDVVLGAEDEEEGDDGVLAWNDVFPEAGEAESSASARVLETVDGNDAGDDNDELESGSGSGSDDASGGPSSFFAFPPFCVRFDLARLPVPGSSADLFLSSVYSSSSMHLYSWAF